MGLKFKQNFKDLDSSGLCKRRKIEIAFGSWERLEESHWVSPSWWSGPACCPRRHLKKGVLILSREVEELQTLVWKEVGLLNSAHETLLYYRYIFSPKCCMLASEKQMSSASISSFTFSSITSALSSSKWPVFSIKSDVGHRCLSSRGRQSSL